MPWAECNRLDVGFGVESAVSVPCPQAQTGRQPFRRARSFSRLGHLDHQICPDPRWPRLAAPGEAIAALRVLHA
jgi:hypothetical protein